MIFKDTTSEYIFLGILFILLISFAGYIHYKDVAVYLIKKTVIIPKYYPKHYIVLKNNIRKRFNIQQKEIPKYVYFKLMLSRLFLLFGAVYTLIFVATGGNRYVLSCLVWMYGFIVIGDLILLGIMVRIYNKETKNPK